MKLGLVNIVDAPSPLAPVDVAGFMLRLDDTSAHVAEQLAEALHLTQHRGWFRTDGLGIDSDWRYAIVGWMPKQPVVEEEKP